METNTASDPHLRCLAGARRTRNRGRGQILVGNTKPSTLQFESDFDFEMANAQFNKDDLEKEIEDKLSVQGMNACTVFYSTDLLELLRDVFLVFLLSEPKESPEERRDEEQEKPVPESESTVEEDPLGPKCFYNKAKCFFDNVSSELKSRYEVCVSGGSVPRSNVSLSPGVPHGLRRGS